LWIDKAQGLNTGYYPVGEKMSLYLLKNCCITNRTMSQTQIKVHSPVAWRRVRFPRNERHI